MRKKSFFYFAAAALSLTFAACSQDDLTSNADVITPDMETSYAKVKISMGSNFGTRAFSDENFDRGTKEEADVKSLMLVLYDAEGNVVGTSTTNDFTTPDDRSGAAQSVSDAYKSTIVKFKLNVGSKTPAKLLAYVNTTSTDEKTLASAIGNTKDGFVMTNSGYYAQENASSWTIATTISDEDLYDTEAEARAAGEDNTVNIYVERLAAKVTVAKAEGLDSKTTADVIIKGVDDQEYKIVFNAKKWAVTGLAKEMYTLKQQFDYSLANWANNSKFSRSYWAKGVNYEAQYGDYATSNPLTYLSLSEVVSENGGVGYALGAGVEYVPEHTIGEKAKNGETFDGTLTSTSLVVVGKYEVQAVSADGNAANYKAGDDNDSYHFYLSSTGAQDGKDVYTIYSQTDMIKELIKRSGLTLSTSSEGGNELSDAQLLANFTVVTNKEENSVELEYTGSGIYYQADGNTWTAMEKGEIENASAKAKMYYNGWAYFWGPITHNTEVTNQKVGYYGVVRNHSYQITINSFSGLGAPMDEYVGGGDPEEDDPDPTYPIIPDPDDIKDAYINATLNVLSWHNIAYGVNF